MTYERFEELWQSLNCRELWSHVAPVASGVDLSVEWLERFWQDNGGWTMPQNTKCFEALVKHLATLITPATAGQVGELVMGGPESRYRPPIIGTAGQVGEDDCRRAFEDTYGTGGSHNAWIIWKSAWNCRTKHTTGDVLEAIKALENALLHGDWNSIYEDIHTALSALRTQPQAPKHGWNAYTESNPLIINPQPQAPVVEVPNISDLAEAFHREVDDSEFSGKDWLRIGDGIKAIHALLSRTGGR